MRVMKRDDVEIEVWQHWMLGNFWEYYVAKPDEDGIATAFVMGIENEIGLVDVNEVLPHVRLITTEFDNIMPAAGWVWV